MEYITTDQISAPKTEPVQKEPVQKEPAQTMSGEASTLPVAQAEDRTREDQTSDQTTQQQHQEKADGEADDEADEAEGADEADEDQEEEVKEEKSAIFETRLETAESRKAEGNVFFKSQDWTSALKSYRSGLYHAEFDEMSYNFELMDDHREMVNATRLPLLLNAAACTLRIGTEKALEEAVEFCDEALKIEAQNPKALFRKGQALLKQDKVEKAVDVLKAAAKAAPADKLIRSTLATALREIKSQKAQSDAFWKEKLKSEMASVNEAEVEAEVGGDGSESSEPQKRGVCHTFLDKFKELFVNAPQVVHDA